MKSTYVLAAVITAICLGFVFIVIPVLSGGPLVETANGVDVVSPSLARAAALRATFFTYFFVFVGAALFSFALSTFINDTVPSKTEKGIVPMATVGMAAGLILMLAVWLSPASDVQQFTHQSVPAGQGESIKNKDFTEAYAPDPNPELYKKAKGVN